MKCVEEAELIYIEPAAGRNIPFDGLECSRARMKKAAAAMELRRRFDEKYKPCAIAAAEKDPGKAVQAFAWL